MSVTRLIGLASTLLLAALAYAQTPERRQIGEMVLEGVPQWDPAARERMLQYLQVRGALLLDLNDDGNGLLIATRFGDTAQLHLINQPLGMRRQLTFYDEPVDSAQFVGGGAGKQIVFMSDVGGSEFDQVYHFDLETGKSIMLTDGKARHESPIASRSGRWLAFSGTARNKRDFDIYLVDLANVRKLAADKSGVPGTPEARLEALERAGAAPLCIWEVEGSYGASQFSPDDTKLLVINYVSERETHWYVVDLASRQQTRITPPTPPVYYGGGVWSHDGKAVYFVSDRDGEFRKLYRFDLGFNKWECLTSDINWDVDAVAVDPTGKALAFVVNDDGSSKLYLADEWGKGRRTIEGLPKGVIGGITFNSKGGVLGLTINSWNSPSDAYTVTPADGKLTRWTESEVGGLNPATFVEPQLIRYPTFDQVDGKPRMIPAFVYKPRGNGPFPVVIHAHGGPEGQFQPTFVSLFQHWANELGICVIAPNVRGSTGYGRSFHQLDNGVKREDSVKDVGALLDWIGTQKDLDPTRVGIHGGSYGGYMVLASLTNYPERFKAGVDIVGIADFATFLQNTEEYRRDLRRAEYGDERDPEVRRVLDQISPLRNADKIQSALFVAHGKNDPRVPVSEAEQIVKRMRELGRPVWYAVALNEGHGFAKKPNRDLASLLYAEFWRQHLIN